MGRKTKWILITQLIWQHKHLIYKGKSVKQEEIMWIFGIAKIFLIISDILLKLKFANLGWVQILGTKTQQL